jgi:ankyrin repeat protein
MCSSSQSLYLSFLPPPFISPSSLLLLLPLLLQGYTPLSLAAQCGHDNLLELLVEAGANPSCTPGVCVCSVLFVCLLCCFVFSLSLCSIVHLFFLFLFSSPSFSPSSSPISDPFRFTLSRFSR